MTEYSPCNNGDENATGDFLNLLPTGICLESGEAGFIAGPCSVESRELTEQAAQALAKAGIRNFRAGIWKPRTHPGSFEGIGAEGLSWVANACSRHELTPYVEVATASHVRSCLDFGITHFWLGARTTVNPFAVQSVADALAAVSEKVTVLVKNPVNPDIELWIGALQRIYRAGVRKLAAVHRGFTLYESSPYRNSPCWRVPLELMRRFPNLEIYCDPSHISGKRSLVPQIAQQALDMGFRGLVVEVHPSPDKALSDASQQLSPSDFIKMKDSLVLRRSQNADTALENLRREIDAADDELMSIISRRLKLARQIGLYKDAHNMPVVQPQRYNSLISLRMKQASGLGLDPEFIRHLLEEIHQESVRIQLSVLDNHRSPDKTNDIRE